MVWLNFLPHHHTFFAEYGNFIFAIRIAIFFSIAAKSVCKDFPIVRIYCFITMAFHWNNLRRCSLDQILTVGLLYRFWLVYAGNLSDQPLES